MTHSTSMSLQRQRSSNMGFKSTTGHTKHLKTEWGRAEDNGAPPATTVTHAGATSSWIPALAPSFPDATTPRRTAPGDDPPSPLPTSPPHSDIYNVHRRPPPPLLDSIICMQHHYAAPRSTERARADRGNHTGSPGFVRSDLVFLLVFWSRLLMLARELDAGRTRMRRDAGLGGWRERGERAARGGGAKVPYDVALEERKSRITRRVGSERKGKHASEEETDAVTWQTRGAKTPHDGTRLDGERKGGVVEWRGSKGSARRAEQEPREARRDGEAERKGGGAKEWEIHRNNEGGVRGASILGRTANAASGRRTLKPTPRPPRYAAALGRGIEGGGERLGDGVDGREERDLGNR
ncbi:hypothetical protein B0H12DRAFT_1271653 [Mycena haematopus]|nr:hypothetical protein B0H12DRAFT_1271653 [Mycena haematopus]